MNTTSQEQAFPRLTADEMDVVRSLGTACAFEGGQAVFVAGDRDIDFFVVESGRVEILNPVDGDKLITTHDAGAFIGDIDLLTRRAVIVSAVARGPRTVLLRVPGNDMRKMLATVPRLGEKLLIAFQMRRQLLKQAGVVGLQVVGPAQSSETMLIREYLHKNFVPSSWYDSDTDAGQRVLKALGRSVDNTPVVECGDGSILNNPSLRQLAQCAGLTRACPDREFDVAIVGAGPAGMTAAVYAASESLATVIIDTLGPGGQAAGSSMIENFIGFPSGLSGEELATRGSLQMLKFGATLLTPVRAQRLESGAEHLTIHTDGDELIRARTVLICTGAKWRRLEARNAYRFENAGVYYAATAVQSRLCVGKPVVVVGGGNSGAQAAMFLSECSPSVHFVLRDSDLSKGMSGYLVDRVRENERIHIRYGATVESIVGDEKVTGVEIFDQNTGGRETVDCDAVFVFIGAEPNTKWMPAETARDEKGFLLTGPDVLRAGKWPLEREPLSLETSIPRVLAAGDVRAGGTKRVGFAVGDGAMAVTCVHRLRNMS